MGFGATENYVEILVEAGDFRHPASDFTYCSQKTLRTNKNQKVLSFYQKVSDQKDLMLFTLFHTVLKQCTLPIPTTDSEQYPKHCCDSLFETKT